MMTDKDEYQPLPSMREFFLEVPLFDKKPYTSVNFKELNKLRNFDDSIDCYCLDCGKDSVFHGRPESWAPSEYEYYSQALYEVFMISFSCTRCGSPMYCYFLLHNLTISKVGQYPSMADVITTDIQKYRKVLGRELYPEFTRAIGLSAHGIGIGAFVYLRRIFENLIEEAHHIQKSTVGWDENDYRNSKMDEKIALLKSSLPDFLVQNKSLYSILSKGIHELQEAECLAAFPTTKLGIELILDEKLEKLKREEKIKQATKDISNLNKRIKRK